MGAGRTLQDRTSVTAELVEKMLKGDRRALSRLISLVERGGDQPSEVVRAVYPHTGHAYCIGVTGPVGAGKSTLVDRLVQAIRREGLTLGILAVDPTSPFSGGAVLGDRIRMQRHYLDEGVFIRSMASRGSHGGLSNMTQRAIKLLDAFGKDVIIVETVGVGQTELDIMNVADTVVVVLVPEAGDAVQTMKAGLMEIADIFVVNKADRQGARRLVTNIEATLSLNNQDVWWRPPIVSTEAHRGKGVPELHDAIKQHRAALEESSRLVKKRQQRRKREFMDTVEGWIGTKVAALLDQEREVSRVLALVEGGDMDPYSAAAHLLDSGAILKHLLASIKGEP